MQRLSSHVRLVGLFAAVVLGLSAGCGDDKKPSVTPVDAAAPAVDVAPDLRPDSGPKLDTAVKVDTASPAMDAAVPPDMEEEDAAPPVDAEEDATPSDDAAGDAPPAAGDQWSKSFRAGVPLSASSDKQGNLFVGAKVSRANRDSTDKPSFDGLTLLPATNTLLVGAARFTPAGEHAWSKVLFFNSALGDDGPIHTLSDMAVDGAGDLVGVAVVSGGTPIEIDGFEPILGWHVFKAAGADGKELWTVPIKIAASFFTAHDIEADARDNSILLAGDYSVARPINPFGCQGELPLGGSFDGVVVKLDAMGACKWVKRVHGEGNERITAAVVDPQGNVYVAGIFGAAATIFDMAQPALAAEGNAGLFVAKLTEMGEVGWIKTWEASALNATVPGATNSIVLNGLAANEGGVVASVLLQGTGSVSIGGKSLPFGAAPPPTDSLLVRFAADGELTWSQMLTHISASVTTPVALGSDGRVHVGGTFFPGALADGTALEPVPAAANGSASDALALTFSGTDGKLLSHLKFGVGYAESVAAVVVPPGGTPVLFGQFVDGFDVMGMTIKPPTPIAGPETVVNSMFLIRQPNAP